MDFHTLLSYDFPLEDIHKDRISKMRLCLLIIFDDALDEDIFYSMLDIRGY